MIAATELDTIEGLNLSNAFCQWWHTAGDDIYWAPNDRLEVLTHLVKCAQTLGRLGISHGFYHGNLKPSNILITDDQIVIDGISVILVRLNAPVDLLSKAWSPAQLITLCLCPMTYWALVSFFWNNDWRTPLCLRQNAHCNRWATRANFAWYWANWRDHF